MAAQRLLAGDDDIPIQVPLQVKLRPLVGYHDGGAGDLFAELLRRLRHRPAAHKRHPSQDRGSRYHARMIDFFALNWRGSRRIAE